MAKVDWRDIVGTVAPTLATALGGPLAGVAVRAISSKLLGREDATEDEVAAAVAGASPETLLQLKTADYEFSKAMKELDLKVEQLHAADRDSARQREIKTGDSVTPRVIASLVIAGWFMIQWYLLEHVIQQEMREIIMRTLGTLDMALGMVLGYYFGSSAGSKEKNAIMASGRRTSK